MKNSKDFLERIRKEDIKPRPKWYFQLKNTSIWVLFVLAILLGAVAFSIVLFSIQQQDFELLKHMNDSKLEMFLSLLPIFWIVFLVIFLMLAVYSIQYSKKGYKISLFQLIIFNVALSILLGTLFFISGGAQKLEKAFDTQVEFYQSVQDKKIQMWSMPEEGYLSGTIISVDDFEFQLKDFKDKIWIINYSDSFISNAVMLEKDEVIKMFGNLSNEDTFTATEIKPWGGRNRRGKGRGR